MAKENYKTADLVQGVASLWLVALMLVYFSNKEAFPQVFILSLVVLFMIFVLAMLVRKRRFNDIFEGAENKDLLEKLKQMKPDKFEDFIAVLFRRLGYQTHRVGDSDDSGVDVTAKKDDTIHYIQGKKHKDSKVTLSDIRSFYNRVADNPTSGRSIFITTNIFTTEATDFAKGKSIEIIDSAKLTELIKQAANNEEVPEIENKQCPRCCK
ncbi:MAG: restriction endonuclease [Bacteroidota bacterium]